MLECQKKAIKNYRKKCKSITIEFSPNEMHLYEEVGKRGNKAGFIKKLIEEEIERTKKES